MFAVKKQAEPEFSRRWLIASAALFGLADLTLLINVFYSVALQMRLFR